EAAPHHQGGGVCPAGEWGVRGWTVRTKLTLWYAGSVGAISLLGTLLLYYGFAYVSSRSVDIFLHEEAEALGSYLSLSPRADVRTYIALLGAEKEVFGDHNNKVQGRNRKGGGVGETS